MFALKLVPLKTPRLPQLRFTKSQIFNFPQQPSWVTYTVSFFIRIHFYKNREVQNRQKIKNTPRIMIWLKASNLVGIWARLIFHTPWRIRDIVKGGRACELCFELCVVKSKLLTMHATLSLVILLKTKPYTYLLGIQCTSFPICKLSK